MMFGHGRLGKLRSLGDGTFVSGAEQWLTPSTAITSAEGVFTSPSTAFSSANLPTTLGVLAVPALLLLLLMGGKKR
jgi:hypothetical protein